MVTATPSAFAGDRVWADTVDSRRAIPASLEHADSHGADASGAWATSSAPTDRAEIRIALPPPALRLPHDSDPDDSDPLGLSTLLYYAVGLTGHDPRAGRWPLHRAVASARCLYPTECQVLLPHGIYRYDAAHHHLLKTAELDPGSATRLLHDIGARAALVVTSRPARTARLYGDYAPRLCAQEAGMTVGALHLTAVVSGLDVEIHQDPDILSALGDGWLDSDTDTDTDTDTEYAMACLAVAPRSGDALSGQTWVPAELAKVVRARHSGPLIFDPVPEPAPRALLDDLARALATSPLPDYSAYLCVNRVSETPCGIYRTVPGDRGWQLIAERDVVPDLERIGQTDGRVSLNFRSAAATVYLAVPRARAVEQYGDDAFRRVHLAAGAAAHRVTIAAACHGLAARVHNGYDAAAAHQELGLSDPGETVVFQLAIGRVGNHAGLRLPVVF
ncbi:nitroreductase family protein [Catenulispora sp. NF23]|uniref:nitroreductase family protein n=1 Tax=Catenulispora pinistramenti TaxID=2705254 RepID=UPI001BA541E3|nr:nitroreductase family protein [Catenulispora pinistramenti]MBS2534411.1 nitroreductase family protein [Catenulispora pinistramenti]